MLCRQAWRIQRMRQQGVRTREPKEQSRRASAARLQSDRRRRRHLLLVARQARASAIARAAGSRPKNLEPCCSLAPTTLVSSPHARGRALSFCCAVQTRKRPARRSIGMKSPAGKKMHCIMIFATLLINRAFSFLPLNHHMQGNGTQMLPAAMEPGWSSAAQQRSI